MNEKDLAELLKNNPEVTVQNTRRPREKIGRRTGKYFAKKVTVGDLKFDSKAEYQRWLELVQMEVAGLIEGLKLQPKFELQPGFAGADGKRIRAITYKADFEYVMDGERVIEDVKGGNKKTGKYVRTASFTLRWKMLQWTLRNEKNVRYNIHVG